MGDVRIDFGEKNHETAIQLLAAAEKLGLPRSEVRTELGQFVVSAEIAAEAGFGESPKKKAAKKSTSSKPTKKAAAKKTTAKKTQE